jgi:hypothetical protein
MTRDTGAGARLGFAAGLALRFLPGFFFRIDMNFSSARLHAGGMLLQKL